MNDEVWRPIPAYPQYLVSDRGRVKSTLRMVLGSDGGLRPVKEKILHQCAGGNGVMKVMLSHAGRPCLRSVKDLVASAFLGPTPARYAVWFRNGDHADHRLVNLHFVPRQLLIGKRGQMQLPLCVA